VHLKRNISGVMKTSAVLISAGGEEGFYRSVQDVPEPLRSQLIESTSGPEAGTIVIADRAGKEQLTQVIERRENAKERQREQATAKAEEPAPEAEPDNRRAWVIWVGLALLVCAILVVYVVFSMHR
jgi:hypothetical protein